jgi:hypothetical protein
VCTVSSESIVGYYLNYVYVSFTLETYGYSCMPSSQSHYHMSIGNKEPMKNIDFKEFKIQRLEFRSSTTLKTRDRGI